MMVMMVTMVMMMMIRNDNGDDKNCNKQTIRIQLVAIKASFWTIIRRRERGRVEKCDGLVIRRSQVQALHPSFLH